MTEVRIEELVKIYGTVVAVDNLTLTIREGEFFTFLGPSGCGKTTTLRLIAGFEYPDKGRIYFDNKDVTFLKPYERNTAMVFQNYALWPHMTVYDNIAYGLRLRKMSKDEINKRVKRVLELIRLEGMENRYPTQLSGGQQQRVALARALVVEPSILLLDEPLSNLDAKLRLSMREEIKRIQKELGITTIYVTHDQEEALTMSDRVAIMNKGRVMQIGTPDEVYYKPRNIFVATFLGRSNLMKGQIVSLEDGNVTVDVSGLKLKGVTHPELDAGSLKHGDTVGVIIRPESFLYPPRNEELNTLRIRVSLSMFAGSHVEVRGIVKDGVELLFYMPPGNAPSPGELIEAKVGVNDTIILPWSKT